MVEAFIFGAALLAAGAEAAETPIACSAAQFVPSLQVLDDGQHPGNGETLRGIFQPEARISVDFGDRTHERGLDEFIGEIARVPAAPLAYQFEKPTIRCESEFRATLSRRGCFVGKQPGGPLMEVSQTEQIRLVRTLAVWRIESLHTTMDAARMDGKIIADERPFFVLPECERAAREADRAR